MVLVDDECQLKGTGTLRGVQSPSDGLEDTHLVLPGQVLPDDEFKAVDIVLLGHERSDEPRLVYSCNAIERRNDRRSCRVGYRRFARRAG